MERLLGVVTGLSIGLIGLVLFSIRRAHIRVEYSVSWLAAAVFMLILAQSHLGLQTLAGLLGVESPALALFLILLCVFILVFYRFSVIISHLKDANIALTQKIAILDYQLRTVHEKSKARSNP